MTSRKAKRMLNESDDWILFTMKKTGETQAELGAFYPSEESWELLFNIAMNNYHVRETLRNILNAADAYRDQQAEDEPE
jgi:hypothetical protein